MKIEGFFIIDRSTTALRPVRITMWIDFATLDRYKYQQTIIPPEARSTKFSWYPELDT